MIQSIIKTEESNPVNEWPKLMAADDGDIVMFAKESVGVLIHHARKSKNYLCEYKTNWDMDRFYPFTGEVTLRNNP